MVALFIWFRRKVSKSNNNFREEYERYITLDRKANLARKKDIPAELFVTPDISRLPLEQSTGDNGESLTVSDPALSSKQSAIKKAAGLKMIKPSHGMSNVDLKMNFGVANLDIISGYEDNYTRYLRALVNYAKVLIERRNFVDAETVLRESISFGSDLSLSYTLLADCYAAMGRSDALTALLDEIAVRNPWDSAITNKVNGHITNLLKNGES